ncbi:MAG: BNR repeat-containing protein [Akkermansiaceae bacterium]|nr:BNR repeat-containing protein [Akkermansiaceae bacterium]
MGQSTSAGTAFRFTNATVVGRVWMLLQGAENPAAVTNSAFLGSGTRTGSGTNSTVNWEDWTGGTGGTIDMRIILDTTGGTGNWTATWYAKRPADAQYTTVRPTMILLDQGINSVAFIQNNLITVGGQQIIAYYRRHATDSGDPANNTIVIGRRNTGESRWELFPTSFLSFNINDTHNVISCAIDGHGFLHMAGVFRYNSS